MTETEIIYLADLLRRAAAFAKGIFALEPPAGPDIALIAEACELAAQLGDAAEHLEDGEKQTIYQRLEELQGEIEVLEAQRDIQRLADEAAQKLLEDRDG